MVLLFFNISGGELFIIVLVIFLIFGPEKIPEIARFMGKSINEIKRATSQIRDEIEKETGDIKKTTENIKKEFTDEFRQIGSLDLDPAKEHHKSEVHNNAASVPYEDPYKLDAGDSEKKDIESDNETSGSEAETKK